MSRRLISLIRLTSYRPSQVRLPRPYRPILYIQPTYTHKRLYSATVHDRPDLEEKIVDFLYRHKQHPVPTGEKHVVRTHCPHCIQIRKNSFAALLDTQKGTYRCTTCKSKGSFSEFSKTLTKKLKPSQDDYQIISHPSGQASLQKGPEELKSYQIALESNPELLNQIKESHHLKPSTLKAFGVGTTLENDAPCLTFPQTTLSYQDHQFQVQTVGLKVCDIETQATVHLEPPSAHKEHVEGLFGYQTAHSDSEAIVLTRRELDAMAAYQATGLPAVSIPTANYQLQESVLPLLDRFNKVYLWLDDDVEGKVAAERFARKIGEHKCLLVNTRQGEQQGPLNAHDALVQQKNLTQIISNARGFQHDQIINFNFLREEVYNEVLHPEQTQGVQSTDLPRLNKIMKGHRPGELTILTGPTGSGKTTIISQLSLDYCKSGVPTLWGSFEILNKRLAKKMLYQYAGKDLSQHPEEFDSVADQFEKLPLYFLKFFSSTAIQDVLKACHHAVYAYDIRHIILDNLQFMLSQQGKGSMDKWDLQDHAIAEIRRFATEQDVHITLVVHPRKDNGQHDQLDIHSIFGSAKVTQEADNVIIIQKDRLDRRSLDIKKNRYDGTLGSIHYEFMKDTFKIREKTEEELKKKFSQNSVRPLNVRSRY
ncbi:Twinkle protein, mitochondrial [Choanephora cucurbitarum]|uniref:Twinkle protein, mitochondrial n=1 Tax=Choanephora cucurbitarum TaxID=101091 RepID=A0A1C7NMR1_9FUNG|nr:Twinkle protein, mitochondrial [Choanephora cucurbitarum]